MSYINIELTCILNDYISAQEAKDAVYNVIIASYQQNEY